MKYRVVSLIDQLLVVFYAVVVEQFNHEYRENRKIG